MSGRGRSLFFVAVRNCHQAPKTGLLSQKNNSSEEGRGAFQIPHRKYTLVFSFFGTLYCLCFIFFLIQDWNQTWIRWKSCLTLSLSVNFCLGVAQQPLCTSFEEKYVSVIVIVLCIWLGPGSLALVGWEWSDWVDCFTWVCSQMPINSLHPNPRFSSAPDCSTGKMDKSIPVFDLGEVKWYICFVLFSPEFTLKSGRYTTPTLLPPGPAIPVLSGHLLGATALSGNYYLGDKYGDKLVLACKMYEVSERCERCTWPGNEWCEGTSATPEPPFSSGPCLVSSTPQIMTQILGDVDSCI